MPSLSPCSSSSDDRQARGRCSAPRIDTFPSIPQEFTSQTFVNSEIGRASSLLALSGLTGMSALAADPINDYRCPPARLIDFVLLGKNVQKVDRLAKL